MTDKVQKILSKIETRKLCTMDEHMAFYNDKAKDDYRFLSEIEEFIKASQEEPVSEDMWEASKQYALRQVLASTDTEMCEQAYLDLRLFSGLELAVAHKDGAQWKKEQMTAKAIDGVVTFDYYGDDDKSYGCIAHDSFCLEDFGLNDHDKVKVIVIKED